MSGTILIFGTFLDFGSKFSRLGRDQGDFYDYLAESMFATVDGRGYAWEKVHEFHEFTHSREAFPPVHFKLHWNQQCIVGIARLFHRYAGWGAIRETFPMRNFPRLGY